MVPGGLSRIPSQVSVREQNTRSVINPVYLTTPNTDYDLYAQMEREQHLQQQHDRIEREIQYQQQKQQQIGDGKASVKITRSIPVNSVSKENDFDNYSFTLNDENRGRMATTETSSHRFDMMEHSAIYQHSQYNSNNDQITDSSYIIKPNSNINQFNSNNSSNNNIDMKGVYRAVEYTKSPRVERVRIKNSEDFENYNHHSINNFEYASQSYKVDAREMPVRVTENEYNHMKYRNPTTTDNDEKTFVVKLFPVDENEKEVQEMTMFVESNEQHTRKY